MRTEAIPVRVRVGEYPGLKHLVRRKTDAWYDIRRRERGLLKLREVVVWVPVQFERAYFEQGVVGMWPNFGKVEGIVRCSLRIGFWHDLNLERPFRKVLPLDRCEKVLLIAFSVLADNAFRLPVGKVSMPLLSLEVKLYPAPFLLRIKKRKSVGPVPIIHKPRTGWNTAVREQYRDLMQALRAQRPKVPLRTRTQVGLSTEEGTYRSKGGFIPIEFCPKERSPIEYWLSDWWLSEFCLTECLHGEYWHGEYWHSA